MTLRPYQEIAVRNVFRDWEAGFRRVALVLPTGAGKTITFGEVVQRFLIEHPDEKVLVLAHRKELIDQAAAAIKKWCPALRVGVVKAASNQVSAQVIVGSQQTLAKEARVRMLPRIGLVVVDECHRSSGPSYLKLLERLGCLSHNGPKTLGVTATFMREDSKRLTDFYQTVSFSMDILDLIYSDPQYLLPPKFKRVLIEGLDLSGVPVSRFDGGKDLAAAELDEAMERAGAPGVVAAAYRMHAADRSGLVFCPTVQSAEHVAAALRQYGITSESLSGATPTGQREDILRRYAAGTLQTVTNCAVLGEGFDAPITSCVVIARPTCSKILFRQQVGRALRLYPGQTDALILDVVGATGRNDLKTLNDVTDADVDIQEGETLAVAARRSLPSLGPRDDGMEGDTTVTGSLHAIDVDPWAIEAHRGRPKGYQTAPMTEEELEQDLRRRTALAEQAAKDAEIAEALERKRRYKTIPMRLGWFLRTTDPRNKFIAIETKAGQKGFVLTAEHAGGYAVGLSLTGVTRNLLKNFDTPGEATAFATDFVLELVGTAMERQNVDPEARWRRRPATQYAIDLAERMVRNVDFDEYHYAGQVSDFITWGKNHVLVDRMAEKITAEVNSSATLSLV